MEEEKPPATGPNQHRNQPKSAKAPRDGRRSTTAFSTLLKCSPTRSRCHLTEFSNLAFVLRKEILVLMGPSGLGKTHLMLALGHKVCMTGHIVWYTSCIDLMADLTRAREQGRYSPGQLLLRGPQVAPDTGVVLQYHS